MTQVILEMTIKTFSAFWMQMREASPFLIVGLFFAGILHVAVPPRIILSILGKTGFFGALRGALLGVPLPLCSCSVLPTALTLRRRGATLSSTISFLISTPETSIDAVLMTAVLLPVFFLPFRPLAAILLSVFVAVNVERFSFLLGSRLPQTTEKSDDHHHDHDHGHDHDHDHDMLQEICHICGLETYESHRHPLGERIKSVFRYSFGDFFSDIGLWIVFGFLLAGLIEVTFPQDFFSNQLGSHPLLQMVMAFFLSLPLYSCATASTPIAAVLLSKGMDPGAALILLLTGPATNFGTFFVLKKELGAKLTAVYYGLFIFFSFILGLIVHFTWPFLSKKWSTVHYLESGSFSFHFSGWIEIASSWFILLLVLRLIFTRMCKCSLKK